MGIGQKFALLIGVGDYAEDSGLKGLSTPARNVAALAEVLGNEAVGGFAVTPLLNPTQGDMSRAIADLFYNRDRDDVLLLYFSGHGITDEERRLYFSNRETRKYADGTLNKGTAISANTIKDMMGSPLHRRVMVVLDCCFGGAFGEGVLTMDDAKVDVAAALGGQGRVVLTAADSMGYALEESDHELSVYTRYFHEGLATGAAASEGAEWISARMLHEYVAARVRQGGYAMKPEIYVEKDGCKINVARAKARNIAPVMIEDGMAEAESAAASSCYQSLKKLLAVGDWEGADRKTRQILLELSNRTGDKWLDEESIITLSIEDLQVIDNLWMRYSDGRFGFSVQQEIYVRCGGKLNGEWPGDQVWEFFGDRVGWRINNRWIDFDCHEMGTFNSRSLSRGHFPTPLGSKLWHWSFSFDRWSFCFTWGGAWFFLYSYFISKNRKP